MTTYTFSIGSFNIEVRSDRAHAQAQKEKYQAYWRTIRKAWTAAKVYTMVGLRNLLEKYNDYLKEKHKEYLASFPKHSIMCECRKCQKSFRSYHAYLKKELRWNKQGHLI